MDNRETDQYKNIWRELPGDTDYVKRLREYNILYRTIYFAANFPSGMPDLESRDQLRISLRQKLDKLLQHYDYEYSRKGKSIAKIKNWQSFYSFDKQMF